MTDQTTTCTRFRQLFLRHQPAHQAWMQPPGSPAKYPKKLHAITDVELAAHLAGTLTLAAPLLSAAAEVYPRRKTLRLPLGVHRWTGRRGQVLFQDGTRIDLDAGPAALGQALTAIEALPSNPVVLMPPLPVTVAPSAPRARQSSPGTTLRSISAFNAATDLVALLEGYGGRVAEQYRGGVLMHCPCGQHQHGDAHPSLAVLPARNARYGRFIAVGYAPACRFYTETGAIIDACAVVCRMEHLTPAEVLEQGRTGAGMGAPATGAASHAPAGGQLSLPMEGGQPC